MADCRATLTLLIAGLLAIAPVARAGAAGASSAAGSGAVVALQSSSDCEQFAEGQIQLANRLLDDNDFTGALQALNRAAENCDSDDVRDRIAVVMDRWHRFIREYGSPGDLNDFLEVLSSQPHIESGPRSAIAEDAVQTIRSFISGTVDGERYDRAHGMCNMFSAYIESRPDLRFRCATAARGAGALREAAADYRWVLNNWSESVPGERDSVARSLSRVYLLSAQFDQALSSSRKVAARTPDPDVLLGALGAMRGKFLEPVARSMQILLQGSVEPAVLEHVRAEMERIDFPSFVGGVYTIDAGGDPVSTFYGDDTISPPSAGRIASAEGSVSLLRSPSRAGRMWILARLSSNYVVVQFDTSTQPEENVILEDLIANPASSNTWSRLYDHEYEATSSATGSVVATLLGGSYLADSNLAQYDGMFDELSVLDYYCVQNGSGAVAASHRFSRSDVTYEDGAWQRSSQTPALYKHEVTKDGRPRREIVWPTYDGEDWSGVVRVGLTSD